MFIRNLGVIAVLLMFSGCMGPSVPRYRYVDRNDPIVDQDNSLALIVDVCNHVDVVGASDYCIIDESKEVAAAVIETIQAYLKLNGVPAQTKIVPFVCGAFDTPENVPVKVAQKTGDTVNEVSKPYAVSGRIKEDSEYLNSLTTLSTYILERNVVEYLGDRKESELPAMIIDEDAFREAVEVVGKKLGVSRLLYVEIQGTKIGGGKKFFQGLSRFTVGVATGVATMGVISTGTSKYGVAFIPGGDTDGAFLTAGLINMETKELSWNDCLSVKGGDPREIETLTNPRYIRLLLNDLFIIKEPNGNS